MHTKMSHPKTRTPDFQSPPLLSHKFVNDTYIYIFIYITPGHLKKLEFHYSGFVLSLTWILKRNLAGAKPPPKPEFQYPKRFLSNS